MCFSNNSGDSNFAGIGVNEPTGSCYMGALRINSNYGFESGWDEPSQELRTSLGLVDTLNKQMGKHSITAGIDLMHQHAAENTAYPCLLYTSKGPICQPATSAISPAPCMYPDPAPTI